MEELFALGGKLSSFDRQLRMAITTSQKEDNMITSRCHKDYCISVHAIPKRD
jgi:hypothetical protein